MPVLPCPQCQHPTPRHLEGASQDAWVNYYRCEYCSYVWNVPKPGYDRTKDVPAPDKQR
jgi:hypothetical protein